MDKITQSPICVACKHFRPSKLFIDYALREEHGRCALAVASKHRLSDGRPGYANVFLQFHCKGNLFVKQETAPPRHRRYLKALAWPLTLYYAVVYVGVAGTLPKETPLIVYAYVAYIVAVMAWLMAYVYSKRVQPEFYYKDPNTMAIVKQHMQHGGTTL